MTDLAAAMMDVWSVIRADLTIADLIRPAEGFGPHTTIPVDFGCVVGSKDPVALDATACRMVGLGIDNVQYFAAAAERNLGNFKEEDIEVVGKTIVEVKKDLWFPYIAGFDTWPEYNFYTSGACSSCESLVAFTMEKLKALGEYEKNAGCHVVVGPKRDDEMPQGVDPNDVILIGDCVKRFRGEGRHWSAGCPPLEPHPLWVFIDREDHYEMEPYFRARMAEDEGPWVEWIEKMREDRQAEEEAASEKAEEAE
jgi:hypothetical protein